MGISLSSVWQSNVVQDDLVDFARPLMGQLLLNLQSTETAETRPIIFSGFFLRHGDRYFWITAGHVIQRLREIMQDDRVRIREVRLRDGLPLHGLYESSLPIDLQSSPMFGLDCERGEHAGLDFGMIGLSSFFVHGLASNPGTKFITSSSSGRLADVQAAGLYVMGTPSERVRQASAIDVETHIYCLPVSHIKRPSAGQPRLKRSIYGRLLGLGPPGFCIDNIDGMSGGPVFAVESRGADAYGFRLVGIQSAWHRPSRTVRMTPITDVFHFLEHALDSAPDDGKPHETTDARGRSADPPSFGRAEAM